MPNESAPTYDLAIHSNPDAAAWAAFFAKTFPVGSTVPDEATMLGWFANAMMAMHDHLLRSRPGVVAAAKAPETPDDRNPNGPDARWCPCASAIPEGFEAFEDQPPPGVKVIGWLMFVREDCSTCHGEGTVLPPAPAATIPIPDPILDLGDEGDAPAPELVGGPGLPPHLKGCTPSCCAEGCAWRGEDAEAVAARARAARGD